MIKDVLTYLNSKIEGTNFFDKSLCLCEKIERDGKTYPAIYNGDNEYLPINLDFENLSYWRKNGDITISKQTNPTGIGVQYTNNIPLKLIGFIKKEPKTNDQYFSDNVCFELISKLTVNNSALKPLLKAKVATVSATKIVTDSKIVGNSEYDKIDFEARYTHAYFSIDFDLTFITNSQCYNDICE